MAKSLKQQQAQTGKEFDELSKLQNEWDKLLAKKQKGLKYDEERLKQLEKEFGYYTTLAKKVDALADKFNNYNTEIEESNKKIADSVENFDEVEESIKSIGFGIAKNEKLYDAFNSKIDYAKGTLKSVSAILQTQDGLSQNQIDNAEKASEAYKKVFTSVGDASKELKRGNITQSEFNDIVKQSYKEFETLIDNIDDSTEAGKALKQTFEDAYGSMQSFNKAAEKSASAMGMLDTAVDQLGSSGIPLVGQMGQAFQKLANKDIKGAKLAITALGAAAAGLAYSYFGAEMQAGAVAANDVKQTQIDGARDVAKIQSDAAFIPQKIQLEKDRSAIESANEIAKLQNEAAYASQRAANSFSAAMKSAAAEFSAASKTALFGNKLGGVGYGAAQLQMAGIGAEKIASAMSAASAATGKMPTGKMGADMAIMAERTGQSVESIASINEMFQRMDGMSAQAAMNMQEGMRAMADNAGISLSNLMTEVAEASKDALSYQIKSGPALAKQVAYAQSLGVSFGDIAKAGKNMVMNYKDSIKAEMQLSSLLGEQVDLTEVRSKFAEGDTEGALKALQAQGLNPADMDMFQQDALSQALGGMDLTSLSKIATGEGAQVGALKAGKAGAENQSFLSRTVGAQAAMQAQQAQIQADQAVIDASLSEKINQAYLASPEYLNYQQRLAEAAVAEQKLATDMTAAFQQTPAYIQSLADSAKLSIERSFSENIGPLLASTVGGLLANKLASLVLPTGGGGGTTSTVAPTGGKKSWLGGLWDRGKNLLGKVGGGISKGFNAIGGGKVLGLVKGAGKLLPGIGNIMSIGSAASNLFSGNFASAGLDLLGAVPGIGNALNIARATGLTSGIEGALNQGISGMFSSGNSISAGVTGTAGAATAGLTKILGKYASPASAAPTATTPAGTMAPASVAAVPVAAAAAKPTTPVASVAPAISANAEKILTTIQKEADTRGIILAQKIDNVFRKMTEVNGNLQKTVDRTHKSANSLNQVDITTKQLLQVNKNLQALMAVMMYEGNAATKLIIDGKTVAGMLARRDDNRKAMPNPSGPP